MFWGALALIILLAGQAAGSIYFSRRMFAARDVMQLRRLRRQVASFSLMVGCVILALGVAALVVLKFTLDGWQPAPPATSPIQAQGQEGKRASLRPPGADGDCLLPGTDHSPEPVRTWHHRLLCSGYCTYPAQLDCAFEVMRNLHLLPDHHRVPARHPGSARRHHDQPGRQQLFARLLTQIDDTQAS